MVSLRQHARRQWPSLPVDARTAFLGEDTEVTDQVIGCGEAVDVYDLGDQCCCGRLSDAGDGENLSVRLSGQVGECSNQRPMKVLLGLLALSDL
jgi:hypothetical protein